MSYTILDMENYKRRAHFDYFRSLQYPYAGTTVNIDVTQALQYSKKNNYSFYLTILHAAALAADDVKELRQRIRDDQIVEYAECPTSHIELLPDSTYCYCTIHHHMELQMYYAQAEKARKKCAENGITELYDDIAIDHPGITLFLKAGFTEEYRTDEIIMLKKALATV